MAKKEANFDLYIHDLLVEAGIQADTQGSNIIEINNALKSASKHKTGNVGFPEYCAVVNDFVLVMEDKADRSNLCAFEDDGTTISLTVQATKHYAVNGALHYAKHILQNTTYDKIFAFGNAGDRKHHIIQPLFVDTNGYTWLPEVETFENFSANHILEYYKRIVLKETPPEDIELADILNSNMNRFSGLFIARMLRQTCSKYSYGKMGNKESIKREKVMLPINDNGKPDYLFMEQYIKYIILKLKTKYLKEK